MAAVAPSESPKRQEPLEEKVETPAEEKNTAEVQCNSNQKDETTLNTTVESPDTERIANAAIESGCTASLPDVSVESSAGADKTTCNSPEDLASAQKMAESSGGKQRSFDWSETEDDYEQAKTNKDANDKSGMLTLLMFFRVSFSSRLTCATPFTPSSLYYEKSAHVHFYNKLVTAYLHICTYTCKLCSLHAVCCINDLLFTVDFCLLSYYCDVLSSRPQ